MPAFQPLLEHLDLTGAVVTADALHTHREHADWLVAFKQADYLFTVKSNQPTLLDCCQHLAWHQVPVLDRTRDVRDTTFAEDVSQVRTGNARDATGVLPLLGTTSP